MKKFLKSLLVLSIILLFAAYSNISMAVNVNDIKDQQNNLKDEKSSLKSEINATEKKIDKITAEKEETLQQVQKLIEQISEYQTDIDDLNTKIKDLQTKITDAEKQIKKDEEEYKKEDEALNERLVAMYKTGETSYLDFLLSSANLVDFISSYYLVSEVADYDTKMLEQLEEHKNKIEKQKAELVSDKQELDTSKKALVAKQGALQVAKSSKENYAKELSEDERKLEEQLSELANHEQSINKKILALQRQYDEEMAKRSSSGSSSSYSGGSTNSNTSASSFGFGWPVSNPIIGTRYGASGSYWSSGHHTGVDFRASSGTAVYSVGDGQVVDTGYNRAYGYFVEIYHGHNVYSFYAHASRVIVSEGQYVSKGQQVMYSGATGNVTGPHLHFEIRTPGPRYANCVNPMSYLP